MRKMFTAALVMIAIFVLASPAVMAGNGKSIRDGNFFKYFYQWLRDDDGDGIPNCLDPDYTRPEDGTGYGKLGPSLSVSASGDQDQIQDQDWIRDRDQDKDGTCDGTGSKLMHNYRLNAN